jgi:hypothetical protein
MYRCPETWIYKNMRDGGDINGPISEGLGGLARADEFFNPIFDVFEV